MRRYKWERGGLETEPALAARMHFGIEVEVNADAGRRRGLVQGQAIRLAYRAGLTEGDESLDGNYAWCEGRPTETFRTWREGIAVLGLAWWNAPDSSRHFRVIGEVMVGKTCLETHRMVREWGLTDGELVTMPMACLVYPELYMAPVPRSSRSTHGNLRRHVRFHWDDLTAWAILGDWCEDNGDEPGRLQARAACAVLERLAPHLEG